MTRLLHRREQLDQARTALEESQAAQPKVDKVAQQLRTEFHRNHLAERVDRSLRGRR